MTMKNGLIIVGLVVAALTLSSDKVLAVTSRFEPTGEPFIKTTLNPSSRPIFSPRPSNASGEGRLISCKAKEEALKTRSANLVKTINTILKKFDAILLGVQNYYTGTLVPGGKTVLNYQTLVTDAQTKRADAVTALNQASTDLNSFSCETGDPRGKLLQFNQGIKNVITLVGAYRTSIKNLIIAVHSVTGSAGGVRPTNSPWPSHSPRPLKSPWATYRPKIDTSPRPYFTPGPVKGRSPGPAIDPFRY